MPFANFKVPAGTLTAEQKQTIVTRVTDLYAGTAECWHHRPTVPTPPARHGCRSTAGVGTIPVTDRPDRPPDCRVGTILGAD